MVNRVKIIVISFTIYGLMYMLKKIELRDDFLVCWPNSSTEITDHLSRFAGEIMHRHRVDNSCLPNLFCRRVLHALSNKY